MSRHLDPGTLLVLAGAEEERGGLESEAAHLEACPDCQRAVAAFLALEARVRAVVPCLENQEGPPLPPALGLRLDKTIAGLVGSAAPPSASPSSPGVELGSAREVPPRSAPVHDPRQGRLHRWRPFLALGAVAAAALVVVVTQGPGPGPQGLKVEVLVDAPRGVVRGGPEATWHLELELPRPAHLLVFEVTGGNVSQAFPHPDPGLGTYGLPTPLPAAALLRVPPDPLVDWPLPAGEAAVLVIPSETAWTPKSRAALLARLVREAGVASPGAAAPALLDSVRGEWPGARVLQLPR
jgi:hypothetical protein